MNLASLRVVPAALLLGAALAGCSQQRLTADPVYFPDAPAPAHAVHLLSFNSLHEIAPPTRHWSDAFRGGPVNPFVSRPAGICYRDNRLYVCDAGSNIVHVWNLETGRATRLGDRGDVLLSEPVDVAVDSKGAVYVADTGRGEVVVFREGKGDRFAGQTPAAYRPVALAVREGELLIADIANHCVELRSTVDGRLLRTAGSAGSDLGAFYFPMGVAVDDGGSVYVADTMNSRVQAFSADFEPRFAMGRPGNRYGDMGKPRHLAVGPDGVVFIADPDFAHIHLYSESGELLMLLGGPDLSVGGTPLPIGVAVARDLPERLAALVPADFVADYFVLIADGEGRKRLSVFAIGSGSTASR